MYHLLLQLNSFQTYKEIGIAVLAFIFAVVILRSKIFERVSTGYKEYGDLADKEKKSLQDQIIQIKDDVTQLKLKLADCIRELDVRRLINEQDTITIKTLKKDLADSEELNVILRSELKDLRANNNEK